MNFRDILWLAANNLTHRGLRSWLTIIGVVVGITAVVAIISMGEGMKAGISSQIGSFGADIITVTPGYTRASEPPSAICNKCHVNLGIPPPKSRSTASGSKRGLTTMDEHILRSVPGVLYVMGDVSQIAIVKYPVANEIAQISVEGVDPNLWKEFAGAKIASGRFLAPGDSDVAVVGANIANEVYSQPLTTNGQILINDKNFSVVGVLNQSLDSSTGSQIIVPIDAARQIMEIKQDEYSSIRLKVKPDEDLRLMEEMLTETLLWERGLEKAKQDFTVRSPLQMQSRFSDMMGTIIISLAGIAAVSLIVGAIGIANTMYASVIERTHQIGILKSRGATNNDVMVMFLIESGLVGLVGGILGIFFGALVSGLLTGSGIGIIPLLNFGSVTAGAIVSPELIFGALLFSIVVGVISGVFPARMASKLQPVEALRYE